MHFEKENIFLCTFDAKSDCPKSGKWIPNKKWIESNVSVEFIALGWWGYRSEAFIY